MHPQVLANGLCVIFSGGWGKDVGGVGGVICCDCYCATKHAVCARACCALQYNAFSARTYAQDL
jgi:hypothetical protein